jgi:hypothetical protein
MYWETSTVIFSPFHVTVLVPGKRVVSVRKGLSSTWPSRSAEWSRLIGNSGLVIFVGFEKVGRMRSTRSLAGAQPLPLWVPHSVGGRVAGPAVVDLLLLLPSHALSASAAARPMAVNEYRMGAN